MKAVTRSLAESGDVETGAKVRGGFADLMPE